jgi:membrane-anchored mycosin MYCP
MTRCAPAAALTTLLLAIGPASAAAVVPPPVDPAALPVAAAPAPPAPTERSAPCRSADPAAAGAGRPQFPLASLRTLWRLADGAGQTVAVIDTGVARHRLLPKLLPGGDYVSNGDGTEDCDAHGTFVAGIIGAAPVDDFAGIAPAAAILTIRQSSVVFRRTGEASDGVGDVRTLAAAVRTAADAGATVINVSTVACAAAEPSIADEALGAALAYAVDVKNVVVVTAAGNTGGDGGCDGQNPTIGGTPDWDGVSVAASPSWYDDYVLTVGSVDRDGRPSAFTLAGPWVDVAAPGEDVVSLAPDGDGLTNVVPGAPGETPLSGTSYAAPVVAGVAALVRSRSPELTARQVMQRIEDTALRPSSGWNPLVGHGVVDALAAVSAGSAPPVPASPVAIPGQAARSAPAAGTRGVALAGAAVCIAVASATILLPRNRSAWGGGRGVTHD